MSPLKLLVSVAFCAAVTGRAWGSVLAGVGDVPHHAGVYTIRNNVERGVHVYDFQCSGAVIGSDVILTTTRCARSGADAGRKMAVCAGMLASVYEHNVCVHVREIIEHEDFDLYTRVHDVAILKLETSFIQSSAVSSVPLRDDHVAAGSLCTISGWKQNFLTVSPGLRYANAMVVEHAVTYEGLVQVVTAQGEENGCILGEEGSPLMCSGLLTGLLHYNANVCWFNNDPSNTTAISTYAAWIRRRAGLPDATTTRPSSVATTATTVGITERTTVGMTEATTVGNTEGTTVGSTEATTVGSTEATTVGSTEATTVGNTEATTVGNTEATTVGNTERTTVIQDGVSSTTGVLVGGGEGGASALSVAIAPIFLLVLASICNIH